jgi:hypothetical protein
MPDLWFHNISVFRYGGPLNRYTFTPAYLFKKAGKDKHIYAFTKPFAFSMTASAIFFGHSA